MFMAKKIITALVLPLDVSLFFLLIGLMVLLFTKRQRFGKLLMTIGVLLLFLFSFPPFAQYLADSLESRYQPISQQSIMHSDIRSIVVLGGGHNSSFVAGSQLGPSSLARLVEALRIYNSKPGMKMILSGGAVFDPRPNAEALSNTALILGVDAKDLVLESKSQDTEEEAQMLAPMLKDERFYLVTSAVHMPRSMALFRKQKLCPVAAPTDFSFRLQNPPVALRFLPNPGALGHSERALREYLGLMWSRIRRKA
jgi:uncharacterized SAM-binding protein YcdF (DUF218 family)